MHEQERLKGFSGEFYDTELERRFQRAMLRQNVQQASIALGILAALFLIFAVVDYYTVTDNLNYYSLLTLRITVAITCIAVVVAINRRPKLLRSALLITLTSLFLVSAVIAVVPLRTETVEGQLAAIVAVAIAIYLFIPNRIPWMLALNAYLGTGFLLALYLWTPLSPIDITLAGLVLILPNLVGYLTARRLFHLQRRQYASLLNARQANRRLQEEISERRRLGEELRYLAQIDDLTGLNNRRWFLELAEQELRHARRDKTNLAICMLDLDHFKEVNDQLGHAAGDRILTLVAELCQHQLRESDIMGRFGGEEFVIALPQADVASALEVAERLRGAIAAATLPEDLRGVDLSATVGIAQVRPEDEGVESALQRADKALYVGKRDGRNTVVVAEGGAGYASRYSIVSNPKIPRRS